MRPSEAAGSGSRFRDAVANPHVAAAHGCTAEVEIVPGYPVTVNDDAVGPHVVDVTTAALGARWASYMEDPLMGAEDFSYVLQRVPGAMAFLGAYALMAEPSRYFGALLPLDRYTWLLIFIIPVWTMLLQWSGTYRSQRVHSIFEDIWRVSRATILGGVALFAFVGLMKASHVSRPFLAVFVIFNVSLLVLTRVSLRTIAHGLLPGVDEVASDALDLVANLRTVRNRRPFVLVGRPACVVEITDGCRDLDVGTKNS